MIVRHVVVHGRVQGVGFRAFVEDTAERLGVDGWVRNRRDGTVEALFTGALEAVDAMIEACRGGPPGARVALVDQREGEAGALALRSAGEAFSVLPTV